MWFDYEDLFQVYQMYDDSMKYDFYKYSEHKEVKQAAEKIISEIQNDGKIKQIKKRREKYKLRAYLKNLICNFYIGYKSRKCIAIPRKKSYYSDKTNFAYKYVSYSLFIFCVDFMKSKGYIDEKKGYKAFGGNQKSKTSKYWAKPKLYSEFKTLQYEDIFMPLEKEIIVKDANKKRINFRGTEYTKILRQRIKNINDLYQKFDFRTVIGEDRTTTRLFPRLSAIYNNSSFDFGGRLYCKQYRGLCYQNISKDARKEILINLNQTVQLDYSSLHLNMLYSQENKLLMNDPYSFFTDRDTAKKTILILLNAPTEKSALYALKKKLKNQFDCRYLIDKAKEFHRPIEKYFGSGIGIKLQNMDSKIALNIIEHFAKRGVPCLPVHDSFIIEKYHQDELRDVMKKTFNDMFHRDIAVH